VKPVHIASNKGEWEINESTIIITDLHPQLISSVIGEPLMGRCRLVLTWRDGPTRVAVAELLKTLRNKLSNQMQLRLYLSTLLHVKNIFVCDINVAAEFHPFFNDIT